MSTTTLTAFFASLYGLLFILTALAIFINGNYYQQLVKKASDEKISIYASGIFTMILGFSIVYFHNIWKLNLAGLVTLLGWITLLKGAALIVFPKKLMDLYTQWIPLNVALKSFAIIYTIIGISLVVLAHF